MSNVEKISVALPSEMISTSRSVVESGEYATASEVIRDAARGWKLKRRLGEFELDELRRLVDEGVVSGPSVDANEVFERVRSKYAAMVKAR